MEDKLKDNKFLLKALKIAFASEKKEMCVLHQKNIDALEKNYTEKIAKLSEGIAKLKKESK